MFVCNFDAVLIMVLFSVNNSSDSVDIEQDVNLVGSICFLTQRSQNYCFYQIAHHAAGVALLSPAVLLQFLK